jgi:hypothetical protein
MTKRIVWAAWILAAATLVLPFLLESGMPAADDIGYHLITGRAFRGALAEGVPYPRWVDTMNQGFGAPIYIFYPPLAYYAVALACSR